ncbi:hypothetical protein FQR65_LT10788 [Abscondita terminalis]|nr:hypothetical protein FQR65_LT10788 [Abscondita terminalis]
MGTTIAAYYGSWKVYTTCKVDEIDPNVADILLYAFAGVNDDGTIKVLDDWCDVQLQGYAKFNRLKEKNRELKTLLSIGGWNEGSVNFSLMVEKSRKIFLRSCLDFIDGYGFDGVDINWEYPCQRGGASEDKKNLTRLLEEMRVEFDARGYILTMAVGAADAVADAAYDVPRLSEYLDYIFVMTYDFHTHADGRTGVNAPLRSENGFDVASCIRSWIAKGASPRKILLGAGAYGHSFTLANADEHGVGARSTGPGKPGPDSQTPGILQYCEILDLEKSGWNKEWCVEQQVPYSYRDDQWVGYDDSESLKKKVDFAKRAGLGGVMFWSIDMDDPRGRHGVKFPLLKTIRNSLKLY